MTWSVGFHSKKVRTLQYTLLLAAGSTCSFAQTANSPVVSPNVDAVHNTLANWSANPAADLTAQSLTASSSAHLTGKRMTHSAILSQAVRTKIETAPPVFAFAHPAKKAGGAHHGSVAQESDSMLVDLSAPSEVLPPYTMPSTHTSHTLTPPPIPGPPAPPNMNTLPAGSTPQFRTGQP
jgi:hypothetical protein